MKITLRRAFKLARIASRPSYLRAALKGTIAAIEHEPAMRLMPQMKTVLDIGAHRGQFSLVSQAMFPQAAIHAFEPQPQACERYRRALGARATLYPFAIGPARGTASMHVPQYTGSASLLPLTHAQFALFPETGATHVEQVQMRRLSDLLPAEGIKRPSLLKIDVQGYELTVLRSIADYLPHIDYLIVEASCVECYDGQPLIEDIRQYLRHVGLSITSECNPLHGANGVLAQVDIVAQCVR